MTSWHDRMLRRLYAGLGVMGAGALGLVLLLFAGRWAASLGNGGYGLFVLAALGLWGGGIAYLLAAVRCPRCGLRLVGHVARNSPAGTTLRALLYMRSCPRCGFDMRESGDV